MFCIIVNISNMEMFLTALPIECTYDVESLCSRYLLCLSALTIASFEMVSKIDQKEK